MTVSQMNANIAYPQRVRKYIAERYSVEDELAILNNYATDPQKYAEEYAQYQQWRAECKARAKAELEIQ